MSVARVTRPPTNAADHSSRGASGSIKIDKINIERPAKPSFEPFLFTIFHFLFSSRFLREEADIGKGGFSILKVSIRIVEKCQMLSICNFQKIFVAITRSK